MKDSRMGLEKDDLELDQLLARGRLSGAEYDAIERRVLERTRTKPSVARWPILAAAALMLVGASALLLGRPGAGGDEDGFRSKGAEPAGAALFDAGCAGARPKVCRLGDTLMFSASLVNREGYLAAYAEPVDAPGTARIWYFPAADGNQPRVAAGTETAVLREGVRLGPPHRPGKYRVTLWLTDGPFEREKLVDLDLSRASSVVIEIAE